MFHRLREFLLAITNPADTFSDEPTTDTPAHYKLLSDSRLSAIVANVSFQYTQTAQQAAVVELNRRGVAAATVDINAEQWLQTLGTVRDDDVPDELTFAESPALRDASRRHEETRSLRSREELKQLAEDHPRCSEPLLHYAQALRKIHQAVNAEALLIERMPILRRKNVVAAALGDMAFERNDANAAIRWYATAVATASTPTWPSLLRLGGFYRAVGDVDAAAAIQGIADRAYGFEGVVLTSEWMRKASAQSQNAQIRVLLTELWRGYLANRIMSLFR